MKRNILLAALVAIATTTVSVAGAPAALAQVECRYSIKPSPGLDYVPPPPPVPNEVVYVSGVTSLRPYEAVYETQQPRWSVVGVRSPYEVNYNLSAHVCIPGVTSSSSLSDVLVDFVALDGNQGLSGKLVATVSNTGDREGTFALEYSTGGPALDLGTWQTLLMHGTPAMVRDVYVDEGTTAVVGLRIASGDADLAVVESGSTSDTWLRSRAQATQISAKPGLSEEIVTLTVPRGSPGRTFGVVVINNTDLTEATLYRTEPRY